MHIIIWIIIRMILRVVFEKKIKNNEFKSIFSRKKYNKGGR